jgi:hypothetical protein
VGGYEREFHYRALNLTRFGARNGMDGRLKIKGLNKKTLTGFFIQCINHNMYLCVS